MLLITILRQVMFHMLYQVSPKISQRISELLSGHYFNTKIYKGHNSVEKVGRVTVLVLCILPVNALYLYLILQNYLE